MTEKQVNRALKKIDNYHKKIEDLKLIKRVPIVRKKKIKKVNKGPTYEEYLKSIKWERIRKIIHKRYNNKCAYCNSKRTLQVHHLTYQHIFKEDKHLKDLILLCRECHKTIHKLNTPLTN